MNEIALRLRALVKPNRNAQRPPIRPTRCSPLPVSMPLVLDLDGTLIAGDLLYKSFFSILRRNPLIVFSCAAWLLRAAPR